MPRSIPVGKGSIRLHVSITCLPPVYHMSSTCIPPVDASVSQPSFTCSSTHLSQHFIIFFSALPQCSYSFLSLPHLACTLPVAYYLFLFYLSVSHQTLTLGLYQSCLSLLFPVFSSVNLTYHSSSHLSLTFIYFPPYPHSKLVLIIL